MRNPAAVFRLVYISVILLGQSEFISQLSLYRSLFLSFYKLGTEQYIFSLVVCPEVIFLESKQPQVKVCLSAKPIT